MAIYRATAAATNYRPPNHPEGVSFREPFTLDLTATTILTGDLLYLCHIHKDSIVTGYFIDMPLIDATATFALGDTTTAALFVTAAADWTAAGRYVSTSAVALVGAIRGSKLGTLPTAPYTLKNVLCITVAGTVASGVNPGTIKGYMDYKMSPAFLKRVGS